MSKMNLNELDINELPFWPAPFRIAVLVIIAGLVLGLGHYLLIADEVKAYNKEQARETTLRNDYRTKYQTAVNLPEYRKQLEQLNGDLETLLAMLPNDDETPKLIEDITAVGMQSGLKFDRIEWIAPQSREFYTALPMRIELAGSYHQIGSFVGKIAGLHRIISVKDFTLQMAEDDGSLSLSINAETYRQQTLRATK
ncbi:type 4a pilus biogenesis protein PilO [Pseudidiomarina mangrovi]|uniref:type 4a pilus biogenesis protein PilO n=1 Tax=Pseudidiomarina mangrovi TaxID=2487133 RepID=UPI000FC9C2F7|nr:type 4a pilus biogenesis protein PilO [Pseudidiomarina mangrovi]CAI8153494.1 MAG: Uncharacterised protein [Pseudidiomarina mangrovi]